MHGIGVSAVSAYTAHREWATRPPDERYASVQALHEAARARRIRTTDGGWVTEVAGRGRRSLAVAWSAGTSTKTVSLGARKSP